VPGWSSITAQQEVQSRTQNKCLVEHSPRHISLLIVCNIKEHWLWLNVTYAVTSLPFEYVTHLDILMYVPCILLEFYYICPNKCTIYICIYPPPPDGSTARGGPWPPLQYASRSLGSLIYLSIRFYPSFSGPWTRHPAISFLVFLFVLLHIAFHTASFLGLQCLAFFRYAQAILFFGI